MDIEGTYTIQAAPEAVKNCLMDQQTLRRCLPEFEQLEALDDQTYSFTLKMKQAPLTGTYQGQTAVFNQENPNTYRFAFKGEGRQGAFSGEWTMDIRELRTNTVIAYKSTIQFGKRTGGTLITPLVKGALKLLIQQFFTGLTDQLRLLNHINSSILDSSQEDIASSLRLHPPVSDILILPSPYADTEASDESSLSQRLLRFLIHRLGIGRDDPQIENQWMNRIKRFGVVSVLLLLVWVGTKLPGKILDRGASQTKSF